MHFPPRRIIQDRAILLPIRLWRRYWRPFAGLSQTIRDLRHPLVHFVRLRRVPPPRLIRPRPSIRARQRQSLSRLMPKSSRKLMHHKLTRNRHPSNMQRRELPPSRRNMRPNIFLNQRLSRSLPTQRLRPSPRPWRSLHQLSPIIFPRNQPCSRRRPTPAWRMLLKR